MIRHWIEVRWHSNDVAVEKCGRLWATRPAVPPSFAGWPAVLAGVVGLAPLGRPLLAPAKFWDNGPDESSG